MKLIVGLGNPGAEYEKTRHVMVAKPLTYMNLSGHAVRLLVNAYVEPWRWITSDRSTGRCCWMICQTASS